ALHDIDRDDFRRRPEPSVFNPTDHREDGAAEMRAEFQDARASQLRHQPSQEVIIIEGPIDERPFAEGPIDEPPFAERLPVMATRQVDMLPAEVVSRRENPFYCAAVHVPSPRAGQLARWP